MMHANRQKNHARHQVGLIVALIILISAASLATGPIRESFAQADAPSWSYTGSEHMNGPASRVSSFNQQVFGQTTATAAAKVGWGFTNSMGPTRYGHSATRLENGKVLVAGGGGWACCGEDSVYGYAAVNRSSELYDPIQGMWSVTGELRQRRSEHTATLLKDGRVLIAGGADWGIDIGRFSYLNSAELYDPATGEWRPTASFNRIVGYPSATLLANGKVLAVGRSYPQGYSAELYDPVTETWSITAAPSLPGMPVLLPDGKVLAYPEIYDPATERWSSGGHLNVIRGARTATLLTNGKVLATGTDESGLPCAELYDPNTGAWSVTGPPFAGLGTVTLLPDGRVLMSGGYTSQNLASGEEIYDPDTGQWSLTDRLKAPRFAHTATLLVDGRVLVAGGFDGDGDIGTMYRASAELYGLIPILKITSASVSGKKLFLSGENFLVGAVILLNGEEEKTRNDDQNPSTMLICKKAGKKIKAGDKLQVRNPDGTLSEEFIFTGS